VLVSCILSETILQLNLISHAYDIPYESATDKSNLFAENFSKVSSTDNYSSQFKTHKQQVENNDHNNITDHFNNNSNCYKIFEILPPASMTGPVSSLVPLSNKFCTILIPPWDTWFLIFIVEFFHWDIITSNINQFFS
jgi:hypothetical protein